MQLATLRNNHLEALNEEELKNEFTTNMEGFFQVNRHAIKARFERDIIEIATLLQQHQGDAALDWMSEELERLMSHYHGETGKNKYFITYFTRLINGILQQKAQWALENLNSEMSEDEVAQQTQHIRHLLPN